MKLSECLIGIIVIEKKENVSVDKMPRIGHVIGLTEGEAGTIIPLVQWAVKIGMKATAIIFPTLTSTVSASVSPDNQLVPVQAVPLEMLDVYGDPEDGYETIDHKTHVSIKDYVELERSRDFYKLRVNEMEKYQSEVPDPYRHIICNILANGKPHP
jgi:hypothetical protein